MDYKKAGVDIEAGDALVQWLKSDASSHNPHQERLVSGVGGFAALFRADFPKMESPCLVSCTDGVGTKIKMAVHFREYSGVAQDLVAMCVNDLICCGAQPLFFLDYYACGKLELNAAKDFLTGLKKACIAAQCNLIGGETAEMPGVYHNDDFDCAGFSVGVVDESKALGAHKVQVGDRIIALPSSGFHSNGFSLIRKVFAHDLENWRKELLEPTKLYVEPIMKLLKEHQVHAIAHVTGGGLDNIPRVLPKNCHAKLKAWKIPEAFLEVARRAEMSEDSLFRTLNCGLGLVIVVPASEFEKNFEFLKSLGESPIDLGEVTSGEAGWSFHGK